MVPLSPQAVGLQFTAVMLAYEARTRAAVRQDFQSTCVPARGTFPHDPKVSSSRPEGVLEHFSFRHNWRVIFRFEDGDAYDVDLIDYH